MQQRAGRPRVHEAWRPQWLQVLVLAYSPLCSGMCISNVILSSLALPPIARSQGVSIPSLVFHPSFVSICRGQKLASARSGVARQSQRLQRPLRVVAEAKLPSGVSMQVSVFQADYVCIETLRQVWEPGPPGAFVTCTLCHGRSAVLFLSDVVCVPPCARKWRYAVASQPISRFATWNPSWDGALSKALGSIVPCGEESHAWFMVLSVNADV